MDYGEARRDKPGSGPPPGAGFILDAGFHEPGTRSSPATTRTVPGGTNTHVRLFHRQIVDGAATPGRGRPGYEPAAHGRLLHERSRHAPENFPRNRYPSDALPGQTGRAAPSPDDEPPGPESQRKAVGHRQPGRMHDGQRRQEDPPPSRASRWVPRRTRSPPKDARRQDRRLPLRSRV